MNDVNRLVICKDNHGSQEDFENAIRDAVMMLLNNRYIMTVQYDDPGLGIVCIDYNYDDESWGCEYPYWLSPEEYDSVIWDESRDEE